MKNTLCALFTLTLLASLAGCGVFREVPVTPQPTPVIQITADQAAQAMDEDHFYATYGQSTLLIQGTVAATERQPDHLILTLGTNRDTQVLCDLGGQTAAIQVGDTVTLRVSDPENDVQRQEAAVFIKNCTLASAHD